MIDKFVAAMRAERLSEQTVSAYRQSVQAFLDDHKELSQETYDLWLMNSVDYAPATVRLRMAALRKYAEFVGVEIDFRKKPKMRKKIPTATSKDIRDALLGALRNEAHKLAVLLMSELGLRVSEACSLRWDDVDLSSMTLVVVRKGGNQQVVPIMGEMLTAALRGAKRKNELVLGGASRKAVGNAIARAGKAVGVRAHPHSLRHGFAVDACKNGAGMGPIQQMLGHSNMATTSRYLEGLQMDADELRKALQ